MLPGIATGGGGIDAGSSASTGPLSTGGQTVNVGAPPVRGAFSITNPRDVIFSVVAIVVVLAALKYIKGIR